MKTFQITPLGTQRSRLARLALSSTLICGLGLATSTVHGQEIGDRIGNEAGEPIEDRLSPGPNQDDGPVRRGIGEAQRALGEAQRQTESLRRDAGQAVQDFDRAISGQRAEGRRLYRDDQGRSFYRDDQGRQIYVEGEAQAGAQARRGQAGTDNRATLGVAIQDSQRGVEVLDVQSNTAASDAGLQQGDMILQFEGEPVQNTQWLGQRISSLEPGQQVTMMVLRDGQQQEISATLQADQRYAAGRPELREGARGDLSALRQEVQQLKQEVQTLRQQFDQIKANSDAENKTQGDATSDRSEQPSDRPEQGSQDASGQDASGLDLEADLEAEAETNQAGDTQSDQPNRQGSESDAENQPFGDQADQPNQQDQ